jgi:hypothetical protein
MRENGLTNGTRIKRSVTPEAFPRSQSPAMNVIGLVNELARKVPPGRSSQLDPSPDADVETRETAALLMAHRARTPIAIAVSHDYTGTVWKVPRPYIMLGWFWVTDAWVRIPLRAR